MCGALGIELNVGKETSYKCLDKLVHLSETSLGLFGKNKGAAAKQLKLDYLQVSLVLGM